MSIDDMIDEPLAWLVEGCVRRKERMEEADRLNMPEPIVSISKRQYRDAQAALKAKLGYDSDDDPLERLALELLIKKAIDKGRDKE